MIKEIHTAFVLVMAWFMLLLILLNKISVRFGNNVSCQIVRIPVGTNIAPSLLHCWFSLILLRFSIYCQAPKEPQSIIWPSGDKPKYILPQKPMSAKRNHNSIFWLTMNKLKMKFDFQVLTPRIRNKGPNRGNNVKC
jgi:hypothetical protein